MKNLLNNLWLGLKPLVVPVAAVIGIQILEAAKQKLEDLTKQPTPPPPPTPDVFTHLNMEVENEG